MVPQNSIAAALPDELTTAARASFRGSLAKRSVLPVKFPHYALPYMLASADAVVIIFTGVIGAGLYQVIANGDLNHADSVWSVGPVAAFLYILIGHSTGYYDLREALAIRRKDIGRIFAQWSFVSLLLASLAFLMKSGASFSRGSVICFGTLALVSLGISRQIAKRVVWAAVNDGKVQGRRAMLLGTSDELASLGPEELLERYGLSEVNRVTFPSPGAGTNGFAMTADEAKVVEEVITFARERNAEQLVLALPWTDIRKIELVRGVFKISPLPLQLLPDRRIRSLTRNPSYRLQNSLSLEIQRAPLSRIEKLSKRLLDVIGATIALLVLAPLMALSAVAIKLDSPGPVLFLQRRNGFNAKQFAIFKLRSMTVMEDDFSVVQAKRFDPRVTRVGRLIRQTSIDEVPQLLNVLRGEMSLVGPRPHALAHDSHYGDLLAEYAFRHHVKPGITGWAQIKGYRGETARVEQMKGRVDCDLWYINNWSFGLDVKILLLTCFGLVRRNNAY